jgi:hypothetical protein
VQFLALKLAGSGDKKGTKDGYFRVFYGILDRFVEILKFCKVLQSSVMWKLLV